MQRGDRCYAAAMSRASRRANRDATINPGKIRMAFAAAEFATPSIRTSIGAKWLIAFFAFPQQIAVTMSVVTFAINTL